MKNKAVVIKNREPREVIVVDNSPAGMIRTAVAGGADLDKLEKLLTLQERFEANEARKAYHVAMAAFKENAPKIEKDKKVSFSAGGGKVAYNHASLYNVVEKISVELSKHGLSASWITKQDGAAILVTCKITHAKGHSEETTLVAAADTTGSKNAIQAIGSTITYLERYSLLALTGLATYEQDDDGRGSAPAELIDEKQLSQLLDMLNDLKGDPIANKKGLLAYLKLEKLEDVLKTDFQKAIVALQTKKRQEK